MSTFDKEAWIKSLEKKARAEAVEWVASLEGIGAAQKSVLFALSGTVNANYVSEASVREISTRAGLSMRTVQHAIYGNVTRKNGKEFVQKSIDDLIPGALTVHHRKCGVRQNLSNLYRASMAAVLWPVTAWILEFSQPVRSMSREVPSWRRS